MAGVTASRAVPPLPVEDRVADLQGVDPPGHEEVDAAIRLRTGAPLLVATLERRAG